MPNLGSVLLADNTELEHGGGDALDIRLDYGADRVRSRQRHSGGHLGREFVVLRHDGLDRGDVVVGDRLSLLDRPGKRGRRPGVLLCPCPGGDVAVDGQVNDGALIQVSQHLLAVLLARGRDVGLGEKRRGPVASLQLPGQRGETARGR